MDTVLLFRTRSPLTDDRLPWLRGSEDHSWTARRNTSGKGVVSAILVRALLSALEGSVLEANRSRSASHSWYWYSLMPGPASLRHGSLPTIPCRMA